MYAKAITDAFRQHSAQRTIVTDKYKDWYTGPVTFGTTPSPL